MYKYTYTDSYKYEYRYVCKDKYTTRVHDKYRGSTCKGQYFRYVYTYTYTDTYRYAYTRTL